MFYKRQICSDLEKALTVKNRAVIIYGPRQSGKTTLIKNLLDKQKIPHRSFLGDDLYAQEVFSRPELGKLQHFFSKDHLVVIDEAQRIENIGLTLKLLVDNLPLTVLASGSASLDLASKINEPLTGRTKTIWLYPFSFQEIKQKYENFTVETLLEEVLCFGMFPKVHVLESEAEKQNYLIEYANNYLYRDLLSLEGVRKPKKVVDLLTLLALQIGKEVSLAELAKNLALSHKTVENYLDVLEKMFVIYNLRGFSRNLRKEVYKLSKYFFFDVGLRNALIRNFNPLSLRQDKGDLLENWFIMERIKRANNLNEPTNFYFWRNYEQKEIDLIEESGGKLTAFEVKWQKNKFKIPRDFVQAYPSTDLITVDSQNFREYL